MLSGDLFYHRSSPTPLEAEARGTQCDELLMTDGASLDVPAL